MAIKKNLYQVVIPARGGSKRFPRKNIAPFFGKPLIAHSIEFALKSFSKENIWVNTDDVEIEKVALDYCVHVTKRPFHLGKDDTTTAEVLAFQYQIFKIKKIECDAIILLQATNPLRPKGLIENCIEFFEVNNRGSLASFSILNRKFGKIINNSFTPSNYLPGQRMQTIIPEYFENGLIYITKSNFINNEIVITKDVLPFIYNGIESNIDIDEPEDLFFAEYVYKKINNI